MLTMPDCYDPEAAFGRIRTDFPGLAATCVPDTDNENLDDLYPGKMIWTTLGMTP